MKQIKSILQMLFKILAGFIIYLLTLKIVRKLVHFPNRVLA